MSLASPLPIPNLPTAEEFAQRPDPAIPKNGCAEGSSQCPFPSRVMAKFVPVRRFFE